jgi:hypothetical protein
MTYRLKGLPGQGWHLSTLRTSQTDNIQSETAIHCHNPTFFHEIFNL